MKAHQVDALDVRTRSSRTFRRNLLISVVVIACILFLAALFIPTLDGPHNGRAARESLAVGKLRRVTTLQKDYASSHPTEGFACQLPLLEPPFPARNDQDADAFLLSEDHAGYRIAITRCNPEPDGVVRTYQITAIPREPGRSGVRAFCTDQTGTLWYDASGSAESCVMFHRPIE
jgi:hypothetical protein